MAIRGREGEAPATEARPEILSVPRAGRFSGRLLSAIHEGHYLRIRSGPTHRFIWIWAVVVGGRVFVRSWNDKRTGWYRAFLEEPRGAIEIGERVVGVRAARRSGERLLDAIERAYAEKYTTPASLKYVKGFRSPRRRAATLELIPR
jgi:hypothetical protein